MSFVDSVLSVFPPPVWIALPGAGVDISQSTVKSVFLKVRGAKAELDSYMQVRLAEGVIVDGDIEIPEKVVDVLRSLRLRYGIRYASACLPEKKAYLYQVVVPGLNDRAHLRNGVEFDFETHVPLPPSEAVFDFQEVRRIEAGTIVAVTAYAKRVVDQYKEVFDSAGIELRSLEVESQALARAILNPEDCEKTLMIIDFGRRTTRVAIVENCVVVFTATLDVGGDALASAIMKKLDVSEAEAEDIKNSRGFLLSKENKDLVEALMITVSVIKDEVVRHLSYWNNPTTDDVPRRPVEKVIICGGNGNLRGFPEYLEGFVNVPVSVANVWENAFSLNEYIPPMPFAESLEYTTAIGLAIRGGKNMQW